MRFTVWQMPVLILTVALFTACDKQKVQDAVDSGVNQATQVVQQTVETVKQEANLAGSMDLATNPPIAAKACYAELIDTGEGRPNVLRLASYKSTDLERYPSIIIEAHVEETSLSALVGKTLPAKVYAQTAEDGVVHSTSTGSPASISIVAVDAKSLTAECAQAELTNSETGEASSASGKFVALLE